MKQAEWRHIYSAIAVDFGYSMDRDRKSARLMHSIAGKKLMDASVLNFLEGKKVWVVGNSPDLLKEIDRISGGRVIIAGKAIERVLDVVDFDILVTDMDENIGMILDAEKKAILVLHAHGDNMDRIKKVVPLVDRFVGTTQTEPFDRIYNFGGFTDGDRAVLMAIHFGAEEINLIGFDFERAKGAKKRKLKWAEFILKYAGVL